MPFLLQVILTSYQTQLHVLARNASSAQIYKHQMGVGAAGNQLQATPHQAVSQSSGIFDDMLLVDFE
jgi:hypothetical protein